MCQQIIEHPTDNNFVEYKNTRYLVNKQGDIKGRWGRIIKGRNFWNSKYRAVKIDKVNVLVHRIVAETFIPNPSNLRDVNHKDGNISNNNVENLEWMSHSDNLKHSYKVLGRVSPFTGKFYRKKRAGWLLGRKGKDSPKARRVEVRDINNNFISFFDTINEAAAYLNVSHVSVVRVCKKQRDSCKNHIINYCD